MPRTWILEFDEMERDAKESSPLVASKMTRLEFNEDAYNAGISGNHDPNLPYVVVRFTVVVPLSNPLDLDAQRILKEKDVPGYEK